MIKFGGKEEEEQTIRKQYAMSDAAWRLYQSKFWEYYEHAQPTPEMTKTDIAKRRAIEYLKSVHMIR